MKMKPSHTPTPWVVVPTNNGNTAVKIAADPAANPLFFMNQVRHPTRAEADAAFIVCAVNAFDAMRIALEAVKRGREPYEGYIATMVNQAIEKAEAKP